MAVLHARPRWANQLMMVLMWNIYRISSAMDRLAFTLGWCRCRSWNEVACSYRQRCTWLLVVLQSLESHQDWSISCIIPEARLVLFVKAPTNSMSVPAGLEKGCWLCVRVRKAAISVPVSSNTGSPMVRIPLQRQARFTDQSCGLCIERKHTFGCSLWTNNVKYLTNTKIVKCSYQIGHTVLKASINKVLIYTV